MKKRPKWFQQTSFTQPTSSADISYSVFKNLYPSSTPKQNINIAKTSSKNSPSSSTSNIKNEISPKEKQKIEFLSKIHQFKHQKQYEEALSHIQILFEKDNVDNDIIYELADTYLCLHDYERAFNWIQKFKTQFPQDCRNLLLEIQLLLAHGKKEEALTTLNRLLSNKSTLNDEEDYQLLDMIIEKLKKIFKADKLMRRCPNLNIYQKKRRQSLKTQKQKNPVNHDLTVHQSTVINSTKGVIMPDTNTNINPALQNTINQIWDMQIANKENISTILTTPCEQVSQCIMSQVLSYKKKLWLFNYLADIFRTHNNLQSAIFLLRQALLLDDENDFILKNLGYLLCQNGEYPNALVVLKDIKHKDFAVLDLITKCQDLKN